MDIGAFNKGKGKKGKGKGKRKIKGKGYGYNAYKGKGKQGGKQQYHQQGKGYAIGQGKGMKGQQQQRKGNKGKGNVKGKQVADTCYRCGQAGHHAKHCRATVYDIADSNNYVEQQDATGQWYSQNNNYDPNWYSTDYAQGNYASKRRFRVNNLWQSHKRRNHQQKWQQSIHHRQST